jgi:hypothetical protein
MKLDDAAVIRRLFLKIRTLTFGVDQLQKVL